MARKSKTYTRGGSQYTITQLGGFQVAEQSTNVINMAADLMPIVVALRAKKLGDFDVSTLKLDWKKVHPMLEAFASMAIVRGKGGALELSDSDAFEDHFAGDLDGIVELFAQSLELNFADFLEKRFGLSVAGLKALWEKATAESESESQSASTGTAGESSDPTSAAG